MSKNKKSKEIEDNSSNPLSTYDKDIVFHGIVEGTGRGGDPLVKLDGVIVFVKDAPTKFEEGDRMDFRITRVFPKFAFGKYTK